MPAVPPMETRFKPGQSGNPKGRPEGSFSLTRMLREKLQEIPEGENKLTYADLLVRKTLAKAIKDGDVSMIRYCYDRLEGAPKNFSDLTSNGETLGIVILPSKHVDSLETSTEADTSS